jgi:hypothetical protein
MYIDHGSTFTYKSFLSPSGNFTISHSLHVIHALAQNVRGIQDPNSGHWDSRRVDKLCKKTA